MPDVDAVSLVGRDVMVGTRLATVFEQMQGLKPKPERFRVQFPDTSTWAVLDRDEFYVLPTETEIAEAISGIQIGTGYYSTIIDGTAACEAARGAGADEGNRPVKAHPNCQTDSGHVCQQPSGRICFEPGCNQAAGTLWGPYWCPECDENRLNRVRAGLLDIQAAMKGTDR